MNVLVVAAHPDDEVLGCGGTIARHASAGDEVFIAVLAEGMMARAGNGNDDHLREEQRRLWVNALRASAILGAKDLVHHDFPDNRMDEIALLDVVRVVEAWIERFSPQTIYTHHGGDLNIDHSIAARAVVTATRPLPRSIVPQVYAFEVLSSTEWHFGSEVPHFRPNVFVGIDDFLEAKIRAMSAYVTETVGFPHPRSMNAIEALARRRGSQAGLGAAEAFELVRMIKP